MNRILEKQLQYDMDRIRADFRLMSDLVHLGLTEAVEALRDSDRQKAYGVILRDSRVDSLESTIDRHCLEFLVKHMPSASHLRFVYSASKMVSEVERVGDYAETIARQAIELSYGDRHPVIEILVEMSQLAFRMFSQSVLAFLDGDVESANKTLELELRVDEYERKIYDMLTSDTAHGPALLKQGHSLLNIANRIERVADQSCNICEEVVYMMTGEVLKHHHEKQFRVLFLCNGNSSRSQMAEAIAKKIGDTKGKRFYFASAGRHPKPDIDSVVTEFLKKRGYDLQDQRPKSLEEVGPLEDYDVVVALSQQAVGDLPRMQFKHFAFFWNIDSLSESQAGSKELALEKMHEGLENRVRDLLSALVH